MSQHNERNATLDAALIAHKLPHDTPSQLSDAFRIGWQAAQTTFQDAEPVDIGYMQKVSEALYENGDPVSIDAAELLERISAPAPKAITASNVDADIEYWRQKYLKLDAMYDELEKEKIAIEQNLMDRT